MAALTIENGIFRRFATASRMDEIPLVAATDKWLRTSQPAFASPRRSRGHSIIEPSIKIERIQ
jgi:hypothetical protein